MNYKSTQAGRTMIEVMGYMAAVMAIVAGVSKIISGAYTEYKISKASLQLSDLAGAIVKASTVDANYEEVVNMIKGSSSLSNHRRSEGLKLIPTSYRVVKKNNTNNIYHAFGGEVSVSIPTESGLSDKFAITFSGLSREQCIELGMKEWINNKIVDLYAMIVNQKDYWYWPIYASDGSALPATRSALAGASVDDQGQCSRTSNQITWIFN